MGAVSAIEHRVPTVAADQSQSGHHSRKAAGTPIEVAESLPLALGHAAPLARYRHQLQAGNVISQPPFLLHDSSFLGLVHISGLHSSTWTSQPSSGYGHLLCRVRFSAVEQTTSRHFESVLVPASFLFFLNRERVSCRQPGGSRS